MSALLPTNRTIANTAPEHVSDHNLLHAAYNLSAGASWVVKTANYALTSSDYGVFSNGASLTHTLPDATSVAVGKAYAVKNQHPTAATLASTAGTIDGATTQPIAQYNSLTVVSDGTNWNIV